MYEFDIRVTGTIDSGHDEVVSLREKMQSVVCELFVSLVAEGAKVGSVTLNGVQVSTSQPDPDPQPKQVKRELITNPQPKQVAPSMDEILPVLGGGDSQ